MKRILLLAFVLVVAAALVYGFVVTRREREYRRLVIEGDYALVRGDAFEAVRVFGDAIALKPESMVGYLKRGDAHRRRGDFVAAASDLERAVALDPASPRALELLGDVETARQMPDRAAQHYQASIDLDDRPRVLYKLGIALHLAGRYREALDAATRALAVDPRFVEAEYLRGVCLRMLDRLPQAREALQRALAASPGFLAAREELAELDGVLGRRADRITELERLVAVDPTPGRHVTLAAAYADAGRRQRARRQLQQAAATFPDDAGVQVALAEMRLGEAETNADSAALESTIEALRRATASDTSGAAAALLGKAYLSTHNLEAALEVLRVASQRLPVRPETFLYLADAAERSGNAAEARSALLDYRALGDGSPARARAVAERIGDLSMKLGEPAVAVRWYDEAASKTRPTAPLLAKLAEAQLATGDQASARATLQRLLERHPDSPLAAPIEQRLR